MTAIAHRWDAVDLLAPFRRRVPEIALIAWVVANLAWMEVWHGWETLPFHFIYFGFAIVYGIRSWAVPPTLAGLAVIAVATGLLTMRAGGRGTEAWAELAEVPMMSLLVLAMVFNVERRRRAVELSRRLAEERAVGIVREREFFSRASHELLTPLTIIRGHIDLLGRGAPPTGDEITLTRQVITEELGRTESLVSELLLAQKMASGAMERDPIDVADLVRGAASRWLRLDQRAWALRIDAGGEIEGAPNALARALESLIENAYRHTRPGDPISITASDRGDAVVFAVEDGGCGIPAAALPHVFERFYRAENSSSGKGTGLGLSVVRSVAEAHGGRARIESTLGSGTRVEIIIPRRLPSPASTRIAGLATRTGGA